MGVRRRVADESKTYRSVFEMVSIRDMFVRGLWCMVMVFALVVEGATAEEIMARGVHFQPFSKREILLNSKIVPIVAKCHYRPKTLNPQLSKTWFEEYFKFLDPSKQYFLESDLDEMRCYELTLCDVRNSNLRLKFLERVYTRYLSRVKRYAEYSIACLEEPMDFTVEESIITERKDEPWCLTEAELQEVWRKQVKNSLLLDRLEQEDEKAAAEKAKAEGKPQTEDAFKPTPVKERLKKMYATIYEHRLDATPIEILEGFLGTFTMIYDPHSAYMAPDSKEDFDIAMRLSLQGIGATLMSKDSYCEIVSLVPGGPAEKEGTLKEGDRIVEVQQEGKEAVNVVGMSLQKIVKQVRGPKGTVVVLTVLEAGTGATKRIRIVRDEVKIQDAEATSDIQDITLQDGSVKHVLVLYLPSFYADFEGMSQGKADYKSSSRDVRKLLETALKTTKIDGVILDLRGNGGGSLVDAVNLAGLFFKSGPVVQTRAGGGSVHQLFDRFEDCVYDGPLCVMVDKRSASASEIVAAALQDMGRALIVGSKNTHGKGSVQQAYDLNDVFHWRDEAKPLGSLKLTNQKFYRISGGSTQLRGVSSDIVFPSYEEALDMGEAKLPHALEWDEIQRVKTHQIFTGYTEYVPALRTASEVHRRQSKPFQEYVKDIAEFEQLMKRKQVSLTYYKRQAERKHSMEVTKKLRMFTAQNKKARERRRGSNKTTADTDEEKNARDIILDETLFIMGKYLELTKK